MNDQAGDIQAPSIRIVGTDEITAALDSAGLRSDRALIVLVGGAGGMGEKEFETAAQVLPDEVVPPRRTGVSARSRRWVRAECAGRAVERQRLSTAA